MLSKKSTITLVTLFFLLIPFAVADCDVDQFRRNLRHALFEYYENPSTASLDVNSIRDLLEFYLTIPSGQNTVTCNMIGTHSGLIIENIFADSGNITAFIPTCSDGTEYGECTTNPPQMCNNGILIDDCDTCGCGYGETCTNNQCILQCSDNTTFGSCSASQPLMCSGGVLHSDCSTCGCPTGFSCQPDGSCMQPPGNASTTPFTADSVTGGSVIENPSGTSWYVDAGFDVGAFSWPRVYGRLFGTGTYSLFGDAPLGNDPLAIRTYTGHGAITIQFQTNNGPINVYVPAQDEDSYVYFVANDGSTYYTRPDHEPDSVPLLNAAGALVPEHLARSGGVPTCMEGLVCQDANTASQINNDCSFSQVTVCSEGCLQGACVNSSLCGNNFCDQAENSATCSQDCS